MMLNARQRRISAVTVRSGSTSNRRFGGGSAGGAGGRLDLRRCKTQESATSSPSIEVRTDKIRNWVVGFLGRKLTSDEEDILHQDCSKIPRDVPDHEAARTVVQSLFSAYFVHVAAAQQEGGQQGAAENSHHRAPKTRTNSIHLEAEAVQVEIMAAFKMQALVRGYLRRQWYNSLPGRQQAAAAARKWVHENYHGHDPTLSAAPHTRLPELAESASARMSDFTNTETKELKQALNQVEVCAATLLQAHIRGYLCRNQEFIQLLVQPSVTMRRKSLQQEQQRQQSPTIIIAPTKAAAATENNDQQNDEIMERSNPLDQSIEIMYEETTATPATTEASTTTTEDDDQDQDTVQQAQPRESLTLAVIPETKEVVASMEASMTIATGAASFRLLPQDDDSEHTMEKDDSDKGMSDISTKNSFGMRLLNESQHELSFVTEVVKENIVIKVQSLVRRFLVRRRRRRLLRKAQSIRMLARPSLMHIVRGTPREHEAVTDIQRIFRGFVQRWKYWTAMRQQQLDEIQTLRAKQLRKIEERKKSVLKSTKKQLFFDATSLARQLQRAKRVIKFLVKEEKRSLQQNERLAAEVAELTAKNQLLENSTKTATGSNETLQQEIQQLTNRNQTLQAAKKEYAQTLKHLTLEWTKTNKQVSAEKQRKEEVKACIEKIKEMANDFLQQEAEEVYSKLSLLEEDTANNNNNNNNNNTSSVDCRGLSNGTTAAAAQAQAT